MERNPFIGLANSESTSALMAARIEARRKYKPIRKSVTMASAEGEYSYSTWADICAGVDEALGQHGLDFDARIASWGESWVLVATLTHTPSGEFVTNTCPIIVSIQDPIAFEAAVTVAKKTMKKLMSDAAEEGDDNQKLEQERQQRALTDEQKAVIDKIESQLALVRHDRKKLEAVFKRIDKTLAEGKVTEEDVKGWRERFPLPEVAAAPEGGSEK